MLPFEIRKDWRDGCLGAVHLSSTSAFDTGAGPEIYVEFKLQGTASVAGQNTDLSRTYGFVTISSTEWRLSSRPDYCNVTYQVMYQSPRNLAIWIPAFESPKNVSFMIGAR